MADDKLQKFLSDLKSGGDTPTPDWLQGPGMYRSPDGLGEMIPHTKEKFERLLENLERHMALKTLFANSKTEETISKARQYMNASVSPESQAEESEETIYGNMDADLVLEKAALRAEKFIGLKRGALMAGIGYLLENQPKT